MRSVIRPCSRHFPPPRGREDPTQGRAPRSERWLSSLHVWQASEARSLTGPGPSERTVCSPSQAPASEGSELPALCSQPLTEVWRVFPLLGGNAGRERFVRCRERSCCLSAREQALP